MAVTDCANLTYPDVTYCNITCEGAFMYACSVGKNVAVCATLQLNYETESLSVNTQLTPPAI